VQGVRQRQSKFVLQAQEEEYQVSRRALESLWKDAERLRTLKVQAEKKLRRISAIMHKVTARNARGPDSPSLRHEVSAKCAGE
jgi:hypothetical protein